MEKEKKKRMTSQQTLFGRIILPGGRNTKPLAHPHWAGQGIREGLHEEWNSAQTLFIFFF